jgi:transglutaminase/protease-like cytokinesis protein 3
LAGQGSYEAADKHALSVNTRTTDAAQLAAALTAPFKTDIEKARAVYAWIAHNISYDINKFYNNKPVRFTYSSDAEKEKILSEIYESGIRETLKKRKGVCEDYSNLFAKMCKVSGIEVMTIRGAARMRPVLAGNSELANDHAWNAVRINGSWKIVDATWGAGNVDFAKKKYIKQYKSEFFLINPKIAVMTHYPADEKDQLLDRPVPRREIASLPVPGYGFLKYEASDYTPSSGIVKLSAQPVLKIRFRLGKDFPERFLIIDNSKKTEIIPGEKVNNYYTFNVNLKGSKGHVITIAGVTGVQVNEIITYKIM